MDPASLLITIATTAITIDQIQQTFSAAPATLAMISSQMRILETGVQRIQQWLHYTDHFSKAQVMHSLEDAINTVQSSLDRLQHDLDFITQTGPKTSKMLGRVGSDGFMRAKFALNEGTLRRRLADVRECVSLVHFTLSVCQLYVHHRGQTCS
jgi:hypothetical protein